MTRFNSVTMIKKNKVVHMCSAGTLNMSMCYLLYIMCMYVCVVCV